MESGAFENQLSPLSSNSPAAPGASCLTCHEGVHRLFTSSRQIRSRRAASLLASGLALVDPAPGMAIAFNAAPGTNGFPSGRVGELAVGRAPQ